MKMRLFTLVWGKNHIAWMEQGLLRSLLWPGNHEAILKHATEWNIYTRDEDRAQLGPIAERLGVHVQFHPVNMQNSSGETMQPCLVDHLRNCQLEGQAAFIAPPDTVFGEGSVPAICAVGAVAGACVAVPHVRVNAAAIAGLGEKPIPNAGLVDFAWENLHKTWTDANATLPETNSMLGGVSWREIRKGLYAVTHRLPTCYLANVDASDVEWFSRQWESGSWDHAWPAKVVKEQRHRMIASSDAAFIIELTHAHENNPKVEPTDPREPDKYFRDLEHNYVNRNTVAIFRGASAGM